MKSEADSTQISLNWFQIWRIAFLHPTIKTFSTIANNPKANIQWGVIWIALTSIINWLIGPLSATISGLAWVNFGRSFYFFLIAGAIVSPILGVVFLLIYAAISHGIARLFKGGGTFQQLVFCWAVIQLPFVLFAGLVLRLPSLLSPSREFTFSSIGLIIQVATMLIVLGIYLYLFYVQVVAFSAIENFGIGKGFGILILQAIVIGVAGGCLSFVFQAALTNLFRY